MCTYTGLRVTVGHTSHISEDSKSKTNTYLLPIMTPHLQQYT